MSENHKRCVPFCTAATAVEQVRVRVADKPLGIRIEAEVPGHDDLGEVLWVLQQVASMELEHGPIELRLRVRPS
jgi:hypothetical protein